MANHEKRCVECEKLRALDCSENKCGDCCDEPHCPRHGNDDEDYCEDCGNDWQYCDCDEEGDDWNGPEGEFTDDYGDNSPPEQNDWQEISDEYDMDPEVAYDNMS